MKVSDYNLNPRWVCWLASRGEDPATFVTKDENGDSRRIPDGEHTLPVGMVFSFWIQARWREWAGSLGFSTKGLTPWDKALLSGHTAEEFDAWLRAQVGVEA